jgi:hypothetical protein
MVSKLNYCNRLCTDQLKLSFEIGIHTNSCDVEKAFFICRDILIQEFESECTKITTTYSAFSFLSSYSAVSLKMQNENINNVEIPHNIIFKRLCKYVFSELTKRNLIWSSMNEIDDKLTDKLMHLTDSLFKLSQEQYCFYMNDNKGFQLELLDDCCAFTLNDDQLVEKQNSISKQITPYFFKGSVGEDSHIEEFQTATIKAFGEAAASFYDFIFNPTGNVFIDAEQITEQEFIKLVSQPSPKTVSPESIIDLTSLYSQYPNNCFLNGLLLKKENVSMLKTYKNPHTANRSRYRPILQLCINGILHYVTTPFLVYESLDELILNQMPFASLPNEWKTNKEMVDFVNGWKNMHDKWLDDKVQEYLEKGKYVFLRNRKAIDGIDLEKEPSSIIGRNVGEIDFIIVDTNRPKIFVTDTKYIKTKYDFASFGEDKSKFTQGKKPYNEQLFIKYEWIKSNLLHLQKDLQKDGTILELANYSVDLFFITNAPSYYSFYSKYPIIPVDKLITYLENN